MQKTLRLAAAAAASLAGIVALMMILWPAWPSPSGALMPWNADGWQIYLASPDGRPYEASSRPFLLITVTFLLAVTMLSSVLSIIGNSGTEGGERTPTRDADTDAQVNVEVTKVLSLVRNHLEANGLYGAALARANDQLPSTSNPEQVRMVISYLVLENENMRKKTSNLQASLEASRRQIEQLRSNLAVAKVEGLSDPLTGVKNRRGFDLAIASEIADSKTAKKPMSLIMADIDHFKQVNDRHGHLAGDEVLKWFATVLGSNLKGRDVIARYGGEEFAIILPQTDGPSAAKLAGQIKAQIESREFSMLGTAKLAIRVTASFGVAQWREGETTDALIKRADAKLYEAKMGGRNRVAA